MKSQLNRRSFLRKAATTVGMSAAAVGAMQGCATMGRSNTPLMMTQGSKPLDVIKVAYVGVGSQGTSHVRNLLKIPGARVVAICDIRPQRTAAVSKMITDAGFPAPKIYGKDDWDFKRMCEKEDLDLVYNAAPWRWHTPICLTAMESGAHAASEVNIGLTVDDLWSLVEMSERTKKHCCMMENCCYDRAEMTVLNMIKQGLFGEMLHGECGYLHDLRGYKLSNAYQGLWRLQQSILLNGNLYPTHGIGPMAWCMDINRGDALDYIVSMSSNSRGLQEYAAKHKDPKFNKYKDTDFALGDVNTCVIKTKMGKTIICKHDTNLPRPYSRDFLVQGTNGIMQKYPTGQVHIEGTSKGHSWEEFGPYDEKYEHPVWKATKERAKGAGHGGMDYIEDYRLIQALRQGVTPDIDVYDSVVWSAIIPLSIESVANGSKPVKFPDFTRGGWKIPRKLGVETHIFG